MRIGHGRAPAPAYNVQTAVDAEHALIVAQKVTTEATDNRSLLPMAEAASQAVGAPDSLHVVADAGYSNGEQAEDASNKASCRMCQPTAPSTTRATARCSTAPVPLRRENGHLPLSRWRDAGTHTTVATGTAA